MDKKSFKKLDSYFKSLLDNMIEGVAMHEMIFDKDNNPIDYKILDVNLSFEKILGLKKDDVNGKLASEIYGYVPALKEYSDVVINKKSLKFKLCHKTKYFDISVSPWNDVGFITIFYDITDRFEIENALKESEFFVRSIVESASLGIIVYDINLNYVLWNPFMEQLTGVKASEIIGKNALTSFHHIKDNNLDVLLYKALNGEECRSEDIYYELPKLKKSGWGVTNYGPLKDTKGEIIGVVAFIKDITDRKNFENEIIKAKDKAEKSEQMKITYFLKASIRVTIFSYLSVLSILTSLKVVFFTISSSSDSLNFLIATMAITFFYSIIFLASSMLLDIPVFQNFKILVMIGAFTFVNSATIIVTFFVVVNAASKVAAPIMKVVSVVGAVTGA